MYKMARRIVKRENICLCFRCFAVYRHGCASYTHHLERNCTLQQERPRAVSCRSVRGISKTFCSTRRLHTRSSFSLISGQRKVCSEAYDHHLHPTLERKDNACTDDDTSTKNTITFATTHCLDEANRIGCMAQRTAAHSWSDRRGRSIHAAAGVCRSKTACVQLRDSAL